jgi:hypothetical protein
VNYRFIFIVGCSGSGTTMMLRILSTPGDVLTLGGNYRPQSDPLIGEFNELTTTMWDRQGDFKQHQDAKSQVLPMIDQLLQKFPRKKFVLYKRSAPFGGKARSAPDLYDVYDLFKDDLKIVVMVRNPIMCVLSTFRRRHTVNLRAGAIIHEEQLSRLNTQLTTLDPDSYKVIRYEDYCKKSKPRGRQVAKFCGLVEGCVLTGNVRHKVKSNRLEIPDTKEVKQLNQHFTNFDERWPLLFTRRIQ